MSKYFHIHAVLRLHLELDSVISKCQKLPLGFTQHVSRWTCSYFISALTEAAWWSTSFCCGLWISGTSLQNVLRVCNNACMKSPCRMGSMLYSGRSFQKLNSCIGKLFIQSLDPTLYMYIYIYITHACVYRQYIRPTNLNRTPPLKVHSNHEVLKYRCLIFAYVRMVRTWDLEARARTCNLKVHCSKPDNNPKLNPDPWEDLAADRAAECEEACEASATTRRWIEGGCCS